MPEPQLPPFDLARVPPVPDEEAIRAFIAELEAARQQSAEERATTPHTEGETFSTFQDALQAARERWSQEQAQQNPPGPPGEEPPAQPPDPITVPPKRPWWKRKGHEQ